MLFYCVPNPHRSVSEVTDTLLQTSYYSVASFFTRQQISSLLCRTLWVVFLLFMIFYAAIGYALSSTLIESDRHINMELKNKDFIQALTALSKQSGIKIVFHGNKPIDKLDITIVNVNIEEAIAKVARRYGVKNHTMIFKSNGEAPVQIDLHTFTSTKETYTIPSRLGIPLENTHAPLTFDQIDGLMAQSEQIQAEFDKSMRPFTAEQLGQLQKHSAEIMVKEKDSKEAFTEEQLEQLKLHRRSIEAEIEKSNQPLSPEQLQKLKENRVQSEFELYPEPQALTQEQILLLQKDNDAN